MSDVRPEWYQLRNALHAGEFPAAEVLLRDHPSLLTERNGIGETVLHFLAVEDSLPGIEWLHTRGGSLDTTNEFGTPLLFEVAQLGYRDLFLWFVRHGADSNQKDRDDRSLHDYLLECDKPEMIAFVDEHVTRSA